MERSSASSVASFGAQPVLSHETDRDLIHDFVSDNHWLDRVAGCARKIIPCDPRVLAKMRARRFAVPANPLHVH